MSEIFVSYAGADRPRVRPLVEALEAEGLQLWWDRDIDSGQNYHKTIERALSAAPCVIVVWTRESVESEWVVNEASDARQRRRLVPVLLDPVTPPLEFRHLQAADLSTWNGEATDPQFTGLRRALVAMLGQGSAAPARPLVAGPSRRWWQTWPGQALGAGGLLIGLSVMLFTLAQMNIIGPRQQPLERGTSPSLQPSAGPAVAADLSPPATAVPAVDRVNLLDTDAGARLLYHGGSLYWDGVFHAIPWTAPGVTINGFAVLALAEDKAATFDTIAVFVDESYARMGVKELAIYASSTSPQGPFVKAAQITVPNHHIANEPFQEFRFAPVQARFVKLQVLTSHASGASAYLGTIQLYASGGRNSS